MPGLSYQKTISHCELLNMTLKPQLEELPHLKEESTDLDSLIVELKGLDQEQQTLRGRLQEITRLRQEAELRGQQLRSRIAAQLRGKLGFTNENLTAFGIIPRKRVIRRRPNAKPPIDPPAESSAPPVKAVADTV